MLFHFRCFFSWDFYLALLNCLRTFHCLVVAPRSPLGRYFAHDTHFALFLVRCFPYFGFILRLLLPLPALLSFVFLRYLLSVACKFITGFRFASYRGVGVGCEAPHLRSISPNFAGRILFRPKFLCICIYSAFQGGLVSWYPRFSSIVEDAFFLRGRRIIARSLRVHLERAKQAINIPTHL